MSRVKTVPIRPFALAVAIGVLAACAAHRETVETPPPQTDSTERPLPAEPPKDISPVPRSETAAAEIAQAMPLPTLASGSEQLREKRVHNAVISADASSISLASARVSQMPQPCCFVPSPPPANTENYQTLQDNPVHLAAEQPVSTFSIDVDTGAYANVRRFLNAGELPPEDAVRVEELLNYFDYDYPEPESRDTPFRVSTELAPTPWNKDSQLLRIGIKGYSIPARERPASNLVFLVDVSGSMQSPDKLPLLKNAFRLLTHQLSARDRVAMVVYAGASGVALESTAGDQKRKILDAINDLEAGGSTNGAAGIDAAYRLARDNFIKGGINRVVLATDGDFNVGTVSFDALIDMVERQRASGVALTALGFGTGNYNEKLLERLADAGNGNYAYVDTLSEARKVLVEEVSSTLFTIARDVKVQVEFNPAEVKEYRLIGYENRILAREDFNNDAVDAGDIGAGHRVTALYEIVPAGGKGRVDALRYGPQDKSAPAARTSGELAFVRLRYKAPQTEEHGDASKLIEFPVTTRSLLASDRTSADFRFAASVAAFGQKLRGGKYIGDFGYEDIRALAKPTLPADKQGYRREFLALVDLAATLHR